MDFAKLAELKKPCPCGSGKMAGACCRGNEDCPCGSGKMVKDCCVVDPAGHEAEATS